MTDFRADRAFADELDARDPLAGYRERFHIPKHTDASDVIYFAGNSLGLMPKAAREAVDQELTDWAELGVEGHWRAKHPWMPYHELLTGQTARLVGALPAEVVVMNSLTVNLHLMMVSFFRPARDRYAVVMEANAFPSDRHAVRSQLRYHDLDPAEALIEVEPRPGEDVIRAEDIEALLEREGRRVALVLLPGVNYYTGQFFPIQRLTRAAHAHGCIAGWDLAHAAGNVPLRLHDWGADFAVWCSYKYLNAGPGTTGGCFVHERHARDFDRPRFAGWWGTNKATRFLMGPGCELLPGAEGWQISNPPILALAALRASLAVFDEVGMERLRAKSELLTGYLEFLLDRAGGKRFGVITPRDPAARGCQLSLRVPERGKQVFDALTKAGVVCDWREPDAIRVAPVPLYNRLAEVWRFAEIFLRATGATEQVPMPH